MKWKAYGQMAIHLACQYMKCNVGLTWMSTWRMDSIFSLCWKKPHQEYWSWCTVQIKSRVPSVRVWVQVRVTKEESDSVPHFTSPSNLGWVLALTVNDDLHVNLHVACAPAPNWIMLQVSVSYAKLLWPIIKSLSPRLQLLTLNAVNAPVQVQV